MDNLLPLFPLKLVVFPGELLNLHIFEPRYQQMIGECEAQGSTFGLPAFIDGKVMDIGTEIKLLAVEKRYNNGELDIKTQGAGIFKITELIHDVPGKLYLGANVEFLSISMDEDFVLNENILDLVHDLFQVLNIKKAIPENDADFNTYRLAHHVGFNIEQEYTFLALTDAPARQQYMLKHLEQLLPTVREMENLRIKAQMNGHFKNVIPPKI